MQSARELRARASSHASKSVAPRRAILRPAWLDRAWNVARPPPVCCRPRSGLHSARAARCRILFKRLPTRNPHSPSGIVASAPWPLGELIDGGAERGMAVAAMAKRAMTSSSKWKLAPYARSHLQAGFDSLSSCDKTIPPPRLEPGSLG